MASGSLASRRAMKPIDSENGMVFGQRLREARVARELDDAHLAVLVGAERVGEVVERLLHRVDHARDVVGVPGVVVDLDRDVVPAVARHLPVAREVGEEAEDRPVHLVVEVAAAALGPLALEVARARARSGRRWSRPWSRSRSSRPVRSGSCDRAPRRRRGRVAARPAAGRARGGGWGPRARRSRE